MQRWVWTFLLGCAGVLTLLAAISSAAEPDPRAKKKIDILEKLLPEYEQAADQCEKAIQPLLNSKNENVVAAVDGARLRIASIRSLRTIIATEPNYFVNHIPYRNSPWFQA